MKIYIATRFKNREYGLRVAADLEECGHAITSRWLYGLIFGDIQGGEAHVAVEDLLDIDRSDAVLVLSENCELIPGGVHFEAGYALAKGKQVFVLGPLVNVFYHHPAITRCKNFAEVVGCTT